MENSQSFKRLIRKYEFLLEDWEDVEETFSNAMSDFLADVGNNLPPEIKQSDYLVNPTKEEKERTKDTESDKVLKKLFRKVVIKCHPDKLIGDISELERIRRISLYERAVSAHGDKNWALMVMIAIKLDVELPEEAESMIETISEEANKLEEKIANASSSTYWAYLHSDKEAKEILVQNYINLIKLAKLEKLNKDVELVEEQTEELKNSKLILGVGHPRTGTGYTAKLLQSWGLDVGHETMGEHGTVDWSIVSGKSTWQSIEISKFNWDHIIYCVRDPKESIASIAYTEDKSLEFRIKSTGMRTKESKLFNAISSILAWDGLIRKINPNLVFRIEDQSNKLFEYLESNNINASFDDSLIGVKHNVRIHPAIDKLIKEEIELVPYTFRRLINEYCIRYGYPLLF